MERRLLYYDRYKRMVRHYDGAPIVHFTFKDVKTGEEIILGSCLFDREVSALLGCHYYSEITDATKDHDIIWSISDRKISPVAASFEAVQKEYRRLVSAGVNEDEINSAMVKTFNGEEKSKSI